MDNRNNEEIKIKLKRHKWPDEVAKEKKQRISKIVLVIAILITFGVGWTFGSVFNGESLLVAQDSNVARFERVYNRLLNSWYFVNDMEDPESLLIENAIKGMLDRNGDKHTNYMTQEESQDFTTSIDMSFVGIGVSYYAQENLITRVFKDSPAEKAGILAGDVIEGVDGVWVKDLKENESIQDLIIGQPGTKVTINIDRQGKKLNLEATRQAINALTWGEMLDDKTAYLEISSFGQGLHTSTENYLKFFKEKNAKNLIIDFRDNGGGYLDVINALAELFFEEGDTIYYEEFKSGQKQSYEVSNSRASNYKFDDIVVLVNENTASASEVFALALRDNLGAKIVGNVTYGKGTVQTQLQDGIDKSYLKVTIAKWFSPKDESIHEIGITPDYQIKLADIFYMSGDIIGPDDIYRFDSVDDAVSYAQKSLSFLGYHSGRTDGYYDATTKTSLLNYKKALGLKEDDIINEDIIKKLYSSVIREWATNKKANDTQLDKAIEVVGSDS